MTQYWRIMASAIVAFALGSQAVHIYYQPIAMRREKERQLQSAESES